MLNHAKTEYRADVDGLRALAVLLVVFYHAGLGFPGGFIGVDIFFVISGYLITGQILVDLDRNSFSLSQFWLRRIRRILPASTAMVLVTLLVGFFVLLPIDYEELAESAIYQQLMLANFYFWKNGGYFDGPSDLKPLLHMWSLAVEEQFYLFYPFFIALLYRRSRQTAFFGLIAVFIVSLALSHIGVQVYRTPSFYLLPTRAWELLLGALIWWIPSLPSSRTIYPYIATIVSLLALSAIGIVTTFYTKETPFPGMAALPPCVSTAALIYIHKNCDTLVSKALSHPWVVYIGLISYSWYLWHWPLFAFSRYFYGLEFSMGVGVVLLLTSFLIASASYHYIETPFRKGRFRNWRPQRLLVFVGLSAFITLCTSFVITRTSGARFRFSDKINELVFKQKGGVLSKVDGVLFVEGTDQLCGVGKSSVIGPSDPIDFIVWGDSHARMLYETVDMIAKELDLQGVVASKSNGGPFLEKLSKNHNLYNAKVWEVIRQRKIKRVLFVGKWEDKLKKNSVDEQTAFLNLIQILRQQGTDVSIMMQVPRQNFDPNAVIARALYFNYPIPKGISKSQYQQGKESLSEFFEIALKLGCELIDLPEKFFDENGMSYLGHEGKSYYWDDDHLSPLGVQELLAPRLREWLTRRLDSKVSN